MSAMQLFWEKDSGIDVLGVDFDGSQTPVSYEQVTREVTSRLHHGARMVVFDMTGLVGGDQRAVNSLRACARLARQMKSGFLIFNPDEKVVDALTRAGLERTVPYRWNLDELRAEMHYVLKDEDPMADLARRNSTAMRPSTMARIDHVLKSSRRIPHPQKTQRENPQPANEPGRAKRLSGENDRDWQKALELYSTASKLADKHGVEISPKMTFDQFTSLMAARLLEEEE